MNSSKQRQLRLGAYLSYGTGHHAGAWRHPDVSADAAQSIEHYVQIAQTAERGLFDFMFLSDTPSVFSDDQEGYGSRVVVFEPITLLSALAMRTSNLGMVATASTTYKDPYTVAREFASLDLISHGRAGWNLVTSSKAVAASNFGLDAHPEHSTRYRRAREFFDVVTGLWDSWDDDAFPRDKVSGQFYLPSRQHILNHIGEYFKVSGPLNISRPLQGRPIIVQAGSSNDGQELAAATAEIVFTAQPDIESAQTFYRELKGRLPKYGRLDKDILVMPGLCAFIGETDQEAHDIYDQLQNFVEPKLGLSMLEDLLGGIDLSMVDVDRPLPLLPQSNGNQSRQKLIEQAGSSRKLTVRELYQQMSVARGHLTVIGSAQTVADVMEDWLNSEAADGFNVMPPFLPGSLDTFVDRVIPELSRRGLFKQRYEPGTLRKKLGFQRPPSRYHI